MILESSNNQTKAVRPYFPNLDGLRFFAFLFVFISHSVIFIWQRAYFLVIGDLGVSFFFVLSGFLITYLLFFEKENSGHIELSSFYLRRILRIWPVYFIVLFIGIIFSKLVFTGLPFVTTFDTASIFWYLGFLSNFWIINHAGTSTILVVLWSISVEEQFYLVWPVILKIIKKRFIPIFLYLLIIIAVIFRIVNSANYNMISYSTFSIMADLAMGALFGYISFNLPNLRDKIANSLTKRKVIYIYTIFIALFLIRIYTYLIIPRSLRYISASILPVLFSFIFAFIIFEQNYSKNSFFKASSLKTISYLGRISYGLYAYHMIAFTLIFSILLKLEIQSKILVTIFSFSLTILVSHVSYKYIEQKILKLKERIK